MEQLGAVLRESGLTTAGRTTGTSAGESPCRPEPRRPRRAPCTLASLGIPAWYRSAELSDIPEPLRDAVLPVEEPGVFLSGPPGRGKTWLAAALLKHLVRAGKGWVRERDVYPPTEECLARFATWPRLLDELRDSFGGEKKCLSWDMAWKAPVLVLDDLGADGGSAWSVDRAYALVDRRIADMRLTIITSNLSVAGFSALEPRLASRLSAFAVVTLDGPDRRAQRHRAGGSGTDNCRSRY